MFLRYGHQNGERHPLAEQQRLQLFAEAREKVAFCGHRLFAWFWAKRLD
jgi:hypothetical protein